MDALHAEVARLQGIGLRHLDCKEQISSVIAAQKANRQALAALKCPGGGADQAAWVLRPGGVWLRLPQEQAACVLRSEAQELSARLEALFQQQRGVLAELEREGLGPEHFA